MAKKVTVKKKYKIVSYKISSNNYIKIYDTMFGYIENGSAFKIYCYLCYQYNEEEDLSSVSLNKIANDCKLAKNTVQDAIKYLEDKKVIKKIKQKDSNNSYLINYLIELQEVEDCLDYEIVEVEVKQKDKNKSKKRNDKDYDKWRKEVLERDNYTCRLCGNAEDDAILNVHHIEKYSENEKLRTDVNNGITLCHECHKKIFFREKEFEEYFKQLIKNQR